MHNQVQPQRVNHPLFVIVVSIQMFLALPIHLQFTAGAVAGVSEILFMYPLDGKAHLCIILIILCNQFCLFCSG